MKIQNNNLNFKATRVLTVQKTMQRRAPEIVDVFKLNRKEDLNFARNCLEMIDSRADKIDYFVKNLQKFFKSFLDKTETQSQDFVLAIKNGEILAGGAQYFPVFDKLFVNKSFVKEKDTLVADSMFYQLLDESKQGYNKELTSVTLPKIFEIEKTSILPNEIKSEKNLIEKRNLNTEFKIENQETDLNKFLGIDEFDLSKMAE